MENNNYIQMIPYTDIEITDKYIIREFNENIDPIELIWHRDLEDRTVEVLEGKGWKFQFDEQIPIPLHPGTIVEIPKLVVHRIIKGETDLKIKILEY